MSRSIIIAFLTFFIVPLSGMNIKTDDVESPVTGYIDIMVESNVNKVLFTYPINESNVTSGNGSLTNIVLPVKDFRCDNKLAFKDFLTLLKADTYPHLTIGLPGKVLQQLRNRDKVTLKNVTINIAGVSKEYDIFCTAENTGSGDRVLAGSIKVDLNELDINPQKKFFGMVRIKDEVLVKFGLGLKDQSIARK